MTYPEEEEFERLKAESMEELDRSDRATGIDPRLQPPQTGPLPPPPPVQHRRLERAPDGKGSGLATGLGHYFGIDVTIVRLAFVVLALGAGTGLLLYVIGSLIVPKAAVWPPPGGASPISLREPGSWDRNAIALAFAGVLAVIIAFSGSGFSQLVLAVALVGAGLWMLNDRPDPTATPPAPTATGTGLAQTPHQYGQNPQDTPLGGPTTASGTTATAANYATATHPPPGQPAYPAYPQGYAAAAPRGGRLRQWFRRLAVGVALIAFGAIAALSMANIEINFDDQTYAPGSVDELPTAVSSGIGDVSIDLTELDIDELEDAVADADAPHRITTSLGVGDLVVVVPEGLPVEIEADVGAGDVNGLGGLATDTDPLVIITADLGVGDLTVVER